MKLFAIFLFSLLLVGCKPDAMNVELYTTDIDLASNGEVFEVPVKVSFSLLGDDKDGTLDRVSQASKKYLSTDSSFSRSKAMMGERLVIDTKLPLGDANSIQKFLKTNTRLAILEVTSDNGSNLVSIKATPSLRTFDRELRGINMMLSLDLPAKETVFRISSDSRKPVEVVATAVFVSKKPYLQFSKELNRRDSVEITFSGKEGSVYSEIPPRLLVR